MTMTALKQKTFEFAGKEYTTASLEEMTNADLVGLHNVIASNLEKSSIRKFKDKATGVKRVWAILEEYQEWLKEEPVAKEPKLKSVPKPKKVEAEQKSVEDLPKQKKSMTREEWLKKAVVLLDEEFFKPSGYKLPEKLEIACGFARGSSDTVGQCWDPKVTADGTVHMFVCPTQDDPHRVLDIVLHEMIHACVGLKEKHGPGFKKLAHEFGLKGKMTATYAEEGTDLHYTLGVIANKLGKYPHSAINPTKTKKKTQTGTTSKWVGFTSRNNPKYKVDANIDRVIEYGRPVDPWGDRMPATKPEVEEQLLEAGV